jgi:hypothetical protein
MSENHKNLYEKAYEQGSKRKNLGFDYHGEDAIVKRTMMPRLFQNATNAGFLRYINNVIVNNIDSVKIIRNFFNYTVKKNDTNIN